MRWDNLFDDLESQLEGELRADEVDLQMEEERLRLARISLRDRLLAMRGPDAAAPDTVRLLLVSGRALDLAPAAVGRDWLSGGLGRESGSAGHAIVPFAAIQSVVLSRPRLRRSAEAEPEPDGLAARLSLGYVLRDLCRRRSAVEVTLTAGSQATGTIDRVGRDHFDLAVHERGVPRRESEVSHYRLIPVSAVELVRTG